MGPALHSRCCLPELFSGRLQGEARPAVCPAIACLGGPAAHAELACWLCPCTLSASNAAEPDSTKVRTSGGGRVSAGAGSGRAGRASASARPANISRRCLGPGKPSSTAHCGSCPAASCPPPNRPCTCRHLLVRRRSAVRCLGPGELGSTAHCGNLSAALCPPPNTPCTCRQLLVCRCDSAWPTAVWALTDLC